MLWCVCVTQLPVLFSPQLQPSTACCCLILNKFLRFIRKLYFLFFIIIIFFKFLSDQRCVRFFYWGTRFCCEMINALWFSYSVCFKYLERPKKNKKKKQSKRETFHKEMIVDTKRLVQDLGNTKTCKAKKKKKTSLCSKAAR